MSYSSSSAAALLRLICFLGFGAAALEGELWSLPPPLAEAMMPMMMSARRISPHPAAAGEVFFFGGLLGRPHFGQAGASVDTSVPQSGHFVRAISGSPALLCLVLAGELYPLERARDEDAAPKAALEGSTLSGN